MGVKGQSAMQGAIAGGKAAGPWGALAGGILGLMQGDKMEGAQQRQDTQNALQKGQQEMSDMRNGLAMDGNDRSLVANSIDNGYGVY